MPILRAGLGMMDGVLENVPSARISVVGMYRNEETLEPVPYFQKLVSNIDERMALIVDPMLATGGSVIATIDLLKKSGLQQHQSSGAGRCARRYRCAGKSAPGRRTVYRID